MKQFTIGKNDAGQRLDRFLLKAVPLLPAALMQKYFRLKRIKVNGRRGERDYRLCEGDQLSLYIGDEFFAPPSSDESWRRISEPRLSILYEDENIVLLDKRPGVLVHAPEGEAEHTLIANLQAYLYISGGWNPEEEKSFAPALCNRIDRNTGGIVIAAKNAEALRIMNERIRNREVKKLYLCVIHGEIKPEAGCLEGYIFKDSAKNRVYVRKSPEKGAKTAVTLYRTLESRGGLSLLECELVTGRTHQIRAQLAAAGHPLLGDGKYGSERQNAPYKRRYQALYSYKIRFNWKDDAGLLEYLRGMEFTVQDIEFVQTYFGSPAN